MAAEPYQGDRRRTALLTDACWLTDICLWLAASKGFARHLRLRSWLDTTPRRRPLLMCCSPALPGPSTHLTKRVEFRFFSMQSSAVRPSASPSQLVHGDRWGTCTIEDRIQKAQRAGERIKQNCSEEANDARAVGKMKAVQPAGVSAMAALPPWSAAGFRATRQRLPARARARVTMPHAEADVRVRRAPCVCTESLLLLTSSIGAAKTLLEAAVHHPRACAASRRGVGVPRASLFASPRSTPRAAPVVGGGLGRLGALRDARVGQHGRLSVCAGRVWCQYRMWARWLPP